MTIKQQYYLKNRLKILSNVKRLHIKKSVDPIYKYKVKLRKRIYNHRRSIEIHLDKVKLLERKLIYCIKKLEKIS